ncbi:MAG: CdaR family protein [Clostridiaceae bacterium]
MGKFKKNDILVKIMCLIASVGLWVYIINNENPKRRATFRDIPVKVYSDSLKNQGLILVPGQEFMATLTIEGPANQVFNAMPSNFSLSVDLSNFTLKEGVNEIPLRNYDRIPSQTIVVNAVQNIKVKIDSLVEKSVDIKKDGLVYTAAEGYFIPEPVINPTVDVVSGPKADVDKVAALLLKSEKTNISRTQKELVRVVAVDDKMNEVPNVTPSKSFVEVEYTALEVQKDVPVTLNTLQPSTDVFVLRSQAAVPSKVSIAAKESILRNITEIHTKPLDLSTITAGAKDYPVELIIPQDVTLLDENGKPMDPLIVAHVVADAIKSKTITKEVTLLGRPVTGAAMPINVKVSIVISGTETDLENINEAIITAGVDVTGLSPGVHNLPVKIVAPKGYTVVSKIPETIVVTITQVP